MKTRTKHAVVLSAMAGILLGGSGETFGAGGAGGMGGAGGAGGAGGMGGMGGAPMCTPDGNFCMTNGDCCSGSCESGICVMLPGGGPDPEPKIVTDWFCKSGTLEGGFSGAFPGRIQINGSADIVPGGDGTLRLTDGLGSKTATAYGQTPLDLTLDGTRQRALHVYFSFSIPEKNPNIDNGEGFAFILVQSNKADPLGTNAGLGYGGITNSVVFEFDTRKTPGVDKWDADHIGFMLDGDSKNHPWYGQFFDTVPPTRIAFIRGSTPAKIWHVWIDYLPSTSMPGKGAFKLYLADTNTKPTKPIKFLADTTIPNYKDMNNYDLAGHLSKAFIGFSAATSVDGTNAHYIHEFEFSNKGETPCRCEANDSPCAEAQLPDGTGTRVCSTGTDTQDKGICVECTKGNVTACTNKKQFCNTTTERCEPCSQDTDCKATDPANPVCVNGICVPCSATNMTLCGDGCCDTDTNKCKTKDMCPPGAGGAGGSGGSGGAGNSDAGGSGGSGGVNNGIIEGSGCACAVPESSSREGLMGGLFAAAVGLAAVRRRRRSN